MTTRNKKFVAAAIVGFIISTIIAFTASSLSAAAASTFAGAPADGVVKTYAETTATVLVGHAAMLEATGHNGKAVAAERTAQIVAKGQFEEDVYEQATALMSSSGKVVTRAQDRKHPALSATDKQKYAQGLNTLATGIKGYKSLAGNLNAQPSGSEKVDGTVKYIGQTLPGSIQNLTETLRDAVAFANDNDIPVSSEVTNLLIQLAS